MSMRRACRIGLTLSLLVLPLAVGQPATAGGAATAEQPMEVMMAATAVEHLSSGDKDRVGHGLQLLDDLLGLEGFRRDTVDQALRAVHALDALQKAQIRGKGQARLKETLEASLAQRLDIDGMSKAAPLRKQEGGDAGRLPKGRRAGFFLLGPADGGEELHVRVAGCADVRAQVVDGLGGALTPPGLVDPFSGIHLRVPAAEARFLYVRSGEGCDDPLSATVRASHGARVVDAGAQKAPLHLDAGQDVHVLAAAGTDLAISVPVQPGGIYRVRTHDLIGPTDTVLDLALEGDRHVSDDADGGWGSQVDVEVLEGSKLEGHVRLKSSGPASSYVLSVEEVFRYTMGEELDLSEPSARLPVAGWSGRVMPVSFPGHEGRLQLRVVAGVLYRFQGDFDMALLDEDGQAIAVRLLREEHQPSWASRPVSAFVALRDGPASLVLRPRSGSAVTDKAFLQVMSHEQSVHTPQQMDLPRSAGGALALPNVRSENSSTGYVDVLAPGEEAWLRFEAQSAHGYLVDVDGARPTANLSATLHAGGPGGEPAHRVTTSKGLGTLYWASERQEELFLRVRNEGEAAETVRVGLSGEPHYNGFEAGDTVTLRKHLTWRGTTNWSEDMERFVGRPARITQLAGRDNSGSWLVRVDLDEGVNLWRTRDLRRDN